MSKYVYRFNILLLTILCALCLVSCPEDDEDEDCVSIVTGDWQFTIIETQDCDGIAETDPENHGLIVTQLECDISFSGTFVNGISGIMTGSIIENAVEIIFFDDDVGCTLTIKGVISEDNRGLNGFWSHDCFDQNDNCYGESGTFTAYKE
ncbi:hypothetical protein JXQ70_13835 [bacterium]|nr:hypothetical protein [bacterium]